MILQGQIFGQLLGDVAYAVLLVCFLLLDLLWFWKEGHSDIIYCAFTVIIRALDEDHSPTITIDGRINNHSPSYKFMLAICQKNIYMSPLQHQETNFVECMGFGKDSQQQISSNN